MSKIVIVTLLQCQFGCEKKGRKQETEKKNEWKSEGNKRRQWMPHYLQTYK
jgi:hypothetical protein